MSDGKPAPERCQTWHQRTGTQCMRPAGHAGNHGVAEPGDGWEFGPGGASPEPITYDSQVRPMRGYVSVGADGSLTPVTVSPAERDFKAMVDALPDPMAEAAAYYAAIVQASDETDAEFRTRVRRFEFVPDLKRFNYHCVICGQTVGVEHPENEPFPRATPGARAYPPTVCAGFDGKNHIVRCNLCPLGPDMDLIVSPAEWFALSNAAKAPR
jgi:hypothetical protein